MQLEHRRIIQSILYTRKTIETFKPDIVFPVLEEMDCVTYLASRGLSHFAVVNSERNDPGKRNFVWQKILKYIYSGTDMLVCQTATVIKLYNAVKASAGNYFATESSEKKYLFFETLNFVTFILLGTAAVGITVCGNEFILCWIGEDYLIPQPLAGLIGLEILLVGFGVNLGQIRNITGVFRQLWYFPLIAIVINLAASIALVHVFGIFGVVVGTILSFVFTNILVDPVIVCRHSLGELRSVSRYHLKNLKYFLTLLAVCAADMGLCSWLLVGHGWISVIFHIFLVGLSVPITFVMFYRKSKECRYIACLSASILRKIKYRLG